MVQIFPSAAAGVSARHLGWILYLYCRQKITKTNKKSAEKGTKKKKNNLLGPPTIINYPDTGILE